MQANYPKKIPPTLWDPLRIEYPVRKHPSTGYTSEDVGRHWRGIPEVVRSQRHPVEQLKDYLNDYNLTREVMKSQTTVSQHYKEPELKRHNKHTSCTENLYIYPPRKRLEERVPLVSAHGTSEMRSAYEAPSTSARLVTDKDQFKHHAFPPNTQLKTEKSLPSDIEPLDTTHDGFEKYLDPYLTTSRLHHRPFTADQLSRISTSRDIVTYYTLAKEPAWTRTPKPKIEKLPLSRPKSMYDREKFKDDVREIRTHNKLGWVPGSFRTEVRDNYRLKEAEADAQKDNLEKLVRAHYLQSLAKLHTNEGLEHSTTQKLYRSENSIIGSGKPLCSVLDQFTKKNKRLELKTMHKG